VSLVRETARVAGAPRPAGARRSWSPAGLVLAALVALLFVTNALPLVRLVERALDASALAWLFEHPQARRAALHSLRVSALVALLATGLGALLVVLLERTDLAGRRALRLLLLIPLVVPPQILVIAWLGWLGPAGTLTRAAQGILGTPRPPWTLYGEGGIVLLLVVFALPVAYLTLSAALIRVPRALEEAARIDGANVATVAIRILLPLLRPALLAALSLTFLAALGNFGIQALLGIPARFPTLPTLIYSRITSFASNGFSQAAALALLLAIPAVLALLLQGRLGRGSARLESDLEAPRRYPLGRYRLPLAGAAWLVVGVFVTLGPFLSMVATASLRAYGLPLRLEHLTTRHFEFVLLSLDAFGRALQNSLFLAGSAALLTAVMAFGLGYALTRLGARGYALQLLVDLPYALPGIVFALALILVWLRSPVPGLQLYGTIWLLLVAYVGHYLAFALQPVQAAWRQVDPALEEAARLDGAGTLRVMLHVLLPVIAPTVLVAGLLVFLSAFTELSLSALLAGSRAETLGWLVFGLEQAGSTSQAAALSVVLVVAVGLGAALIALLRRWVFVPLPAPPR
jgi:iron(III) transport system permease protein